MKTISLFTLSILTALSISVISCRSSKSKDEPVIVSGKRPSASASSHAAATHLPPGQAKKLSGDQSAKAYAPGQQKKKNKNKKKRG